MSDERVDIGKVIEEETEKRLLEMESPEYEFPKKATKADAIGIVAAILVCLVLIILCMTGVIE